jgi:hypothetical protein
MSKTVKDFASFRTAWTKIVDRAQDGDTVMLIKVKGDARNGLGGDFPYLKSVTLPCYSVWGKWDEYVSTRDSAKKDLKDAFEFALKSDRPDQTLLLNSIQGASKYFVGRPGRHMLVLETDGLEDYDSTRFAQGRLTADKEREIIARQRLSEIAARLKGAEVWFVAAGCDSIAKAREVENFWSLYFHSMGAYLPPHRYSGDLVDYQR